MGKPGSMPNGAFSFRRNRLIRCSKARDKYIQQFPQQLGKFNIVMSTSASTISLALWIHVYYSLMART